MAVLTYNDQLRQLLFGVKCVLAFDTAADFLGLTNGGYRAKAQIFVNKKQELEGTEQILVPSLEIIECEEHHESFDELKIPEHLQERFKRYREWALKYYEE